MRKSLALTLLVTTLTFAGVARAAVLIDVVQQAPGSTLWDLTVSTTAGERVGGLGLLATQNVVSLVLAPGPWNPPIGPLGPLEPGDPYNIVAINTPLGVAITAGLTPTLVGTFTILNATGADMLPGDELFGYTAIADDASGTPLLNVVLTQRAAPEPVFAALLAMACAGIALSRNTRD